jgi:molecular chaperone GrpE
MSNDAHDKVNETEELESDAIEDEVAADSDEESVSVEVTPDMVEDLPVENEAKDLSEQLDAKDAELRQATEKHLRLAAEYDNFRKRTIREKEDFHKFASSSIVEKLLPVLDTVSRGVEFNKTADSIDSVREGLEKVDKMFQEILKSEGLETIDDSEIAFDPNMHMAVFQEERTDLPDQTVVQVFEKGYKFKDKVLRPAKVKVSKNDGEVQEPSVSNGEEAGE